MSSNLPAHHANSARTLFKNPWDVPKGWLATAQSWIPNRIPLAWASEHRVKVKPVEVVKPTWGAGDQRREVIKATKTTNLPALPE